MTALAWDERRAGEWTATVLPGGGSRDRIKRELRALGWPDDVLARALEDLEAHALVAAPAETG